MTHQALHGWRRRALLAAATVLLGLLHAAASSSQTLDRVDELMREGRMEAAREALLEWQAGAARPGRDDRQRALWFRAVLTVDPAQAEPVLRRLTLEYPGGAFTDRALYRLGVAAGLRGEPAVAARHFDVLLRDYPNSPVRTRAREWLGENRVAVAGVGAGQSPETGPGEPEPRQGAGRGAEPSAQGGQGGDFAAQVGAFGNLENARAVAVRLDEAGFRARVVLIRGSDFFRVRVGRFETADEARDLIQRLRDRGFDAGLGTAASTERPAGGGGLPD